MRIEVAINASTKIKLEVKNHQQTNCDLIVIWDFCNFMTSHSIPVLIWLKQSSLDKDLLHK